MRAGVMVGGRYYTCDGEPMCVGEISTLSDILLTPSEVPLEYCIKPHSVIKEKGWIYLKGAKKEQNW